MNCKFVELVVQKSITRNLYWLESSQHIVGWFPSRAEIPGCPKLLNIFIQDSSCIIIVSSSLYKKMFFFRLIVIVPHFTTGTNKVGQESSFQNSMLHNVKVCYRCSCPVILVLKFANFVFFLGCGCC